MSFFEKLLGLPGALKKSNGRKSKVLYHPNTQRLTDSGPTCLEVFLPWVWFEMLVDVDGHYGAKRSLKRGMELVDQGEFEQAVVELRGAVWLFSSEGHFERGRAYWYLGRFREAIEDLLVAAQSNPTDPKWLFYIYYLLGDSYRQMGASEQAIFNLGIALRHDAASALAYLSRGRAYVDKNDIPRAAADLSEAIRLDPGVKTELPFVP